MDNLDSITLPEIDHFRRDQLSRQHYVPVINKLVGDSFKTPFYMRRARGNYHLASEAFEPLKQENYLGLIASTPVLFGKDIYFGGFGEGLCAEEERDGSVIRVLPEYKPFALDYASRFEKLFYTPARVIVDNRVWSDPNAYKKQPLTRKEVELQSIIDSIR